MHVARSTEPRARHIARSGSGADSQSERGANPPESPIAEGRDADTVKDVAFEQRGFVERLRDDRLDVVRQPGQAAESAQIQKPSGTWLVMAQ